MKWNVGQPVICDRPVKPLIDCYIRTIDSYGTITIVCPANNTVICGQRHALERLGWRVR